MADIRNIEQTEHQNPDSLQVSTQHLMGHSQQAIFEISLTPHETKSEDHLSSPPGWESLRLSEAGPFQWKPEDKSLTWNGKLLLKAKSFPHLKVCDTAKLPGFLCRKGDPLPKGSTESLVWNWHLPDHVNLYGLGQRSGPLERKGLKATNWTTDSPTGHNRTTDPLYQAHPLLWGKTDSCWWAWLYKHTGYSHFDLAQSEPNLLQSITLGDSLRFQVHAAESPVDLLQSLRQTLGSPQLPPLWAFGFHQSRWGYKSADEVGALIENFQNRSLPLDVVHLDIDHMDDYRSFSFHNERFPEPKEQFQDWEAKGVKVVTIVDPGLKFESNQEYEALASGLKGDHFIKSPSGAPQVGYCWPDEALFPDFNHERTQDWWAEQCQFYLSRGVAGIWIDMNEPAIFDKPFWSGGVKQHPMPLNTPWGDSDHLTLRNLYGSCMSRATQKAWKNKKKRPWVLTRSGFTGVSSYAWSWMGDNTSWWEHLQLSLPQLSSMSLVNSSFVGVDIGGFFGHCTASLYSAWIEASIIYPFMRAHSAMGTTEQHPWSFGPQVEAIARRALNLRYRLLPYIYSAAVHHCEGGLPLLRPLFFDFPEEGFQFTEDQVMFGPDILACPFLKQGESERLVRLPAGEWFNFHTAEPLEGGRSITVKRNPGLIPLFVRAGSTLPLLQSEAQNSTEASADSLLFRHFPSDGYRSSHFYWDQGEGHSHKQGESLRLELCNKLSQLEARVVHSSEQFLTKQFQIESARDTTWEPGISGTIDKLKTR